MTTIGKIHKYDLEQNVYEMSQLLGVFSDLT